MANGWSSDSWDRAIMEMMSTSTRFIILRSFMMKVSHFIFFFTFVFFSFFAFCDST